MVSETNFSKNKTAQTANCEFYNEDRPRNGNRNIRDGTAIYVKNGFNVSLINIPNLNCTEVAHIVLDFPIVLNSLTAAVYLSPRNNLLRASKRALIKSDLTKLTKDFPNLILAGDFNTYHIS